MQYTLEGYFPEKVPRATGFSLTAYLFHSESEALCSVVLLCECSKAEWIQEACSLLAVQAYLVKPVSEQNLEPAIELALARYRYFERAQISPPSVA
jgi:AmiR/NasT family two-component response regulator